MKRYIVWIVSIIGGLIIALAGFTAWLAGTNQGTRWLLDKAFQTVSTKVTIDHIDGTLLSGLTLSDMNVEFPARSITAEKVTLSIQPLYLLGGNLGINELQLRNVKLVDKTTTTLPFDLVWPRLPQRFLFLRCSIKDFQIRNFVYSDPAGEIIRVGFFRGRADWLLGTLYLKKIDLQSSAGKITGSAAAGFVKPSLSGDLTFSPLQPVFDHDRFDLQMKSVKPAVGEQVASSINLTAYLKNQEHLRAEGVIGLKRTGIPFHNVKIREYQRQGFATAEGGLILSGSEPRFDLQLQIRDLALKKDMQGAVILKNKPSSGSTFSSLDAALGKFTESLRQKKSQSESKGKTGDGPKRNLPATVSGIISLKGSFRNYNGDFALRHKSPALPWLEGKLQGQITGDAQSVKLTNIVGNILGGSVAGSLDWDWQKKNQLSWTLQGRNLDPAKVKPELIGVVNADVRGSLAWDKTAPLTGTASINLIKSTLNKRALEGSLEASYGQGDITLLQGYVRGKGFQISVKGKPADLMNYEINAADLSGLIPEVRGQMKASGWIRWKKEEIAGLLKGSGVFPIDGGTIRTPRTYLQWTWNKNGLQARWNVALDPSGQVEGSFASAEPFHFAVPEEGKLKASWHSIDSGFLQRWYDKSINVQGKLGGQLQGSLHKGAITITEGDIVLSNGKFSWNTEKGLIATAINRASLHFIWENEKGLQARWNVALDPSGQVEGSFTSAEPFHFAVPEEGKLKASWHSVDPGFLQRWYDKSISVQGKLSGQLQASLHKGAEVTAEGDLAMNNGKVSWNTGRGLVTASISRASLHFIWENDAVRGNLALRLADYGHLDGDFQLPLTSRFPIRMLDTGAVRAQGSGALREKGILSALFPGSVAESHGKAQFQVTASGTWAKPDFRGRATLEEAGAYFPQTGIRLDNAGAEAEWVADRINIKSFHFRSGQSELHGAATLWIAAGELSRYEGTITGEKVQVIYLPEIRIWASPDLQFSGDLKKMFLRGSVRIPEALFSQTGKAGLITASPDVVIVDQRGKKKAASIPFIIDTNISLLLGNKFRVETEGLHATLGGKVTLKGSSLDKLLLDGQVAIAKGYYEHYGTRLDIVRGRAVFREEQADRGSLDILALKKIRDAEKGIDVEAGVTISGTVRSPLVKLYGRPAMTDRDALSYIVIGKPYSESTGSSQKDQMAQWAATILAGSSSSSFTKRMKELLGVSVGVEAGSKGGVTSSLVTVGKYLSPDLYVAVGRAVFGDDYYLSARYSFLKHWQVETKVGLHSATDIFYRIEFD